MRVALILVGLSTEVTRGENAGRTLEHDFVVLEQVERPADQRWTLPADIPRRGQARTALVAWVSDPERQGPIQAAGGYLPAERDPARAE